MRSGNGQRSMEEQVGLEKEKNTPQSEGRSGVAWWNRAGFQAVCKYFLLCSFVSFFGWLFETVSFAILWIKDDRGFLTLPFCFLYGSSVLLVYFLFGTPFGGRMRKVRAALAGKHPSRLRTCAAAVGQVFVYFVAVALLATLIEFITGLVFVNWLDIPLWSYGNFNHTYMDIVCLDFSLLWGALITIGMATLWPFFVWLEGKLSPRVRAASAIVLALLLSCDFIFNCLYFASTGYHFQLF